MSYRLGVDIGGTFTDATLVDESTGAVRIAKVSSTPSDPSAGFMEATTRILAEAGVSGDALRYVVHATTVATNSIIEGKVARTGFVTTEGFRDLLEIARQVRPTLYDVHFEKPRPLVPRDLCFGVRERLEPDGSALVPLDEESVRVVAKRLRDEGVEAVAVCLLHAYVNGEHERRVGEILRDVFPDALVSLSSEVAPEFREYLRASTTVINAGIQPIVARYLASIEERLREAGVGAELLVMQSNGGVFSSSAASMRPVFMVESGPAAGVIAAGSLGEALGHADLISFDMGGTTAKVGLIQDGSPKVTKDYQVGAAARAGIGGLALSGYPVRTPVIDLVEIGAGGGSIAWIDSGGLLRVGPQSAGADPGPVCYGRGGERPTVTDANLVLGRLNPSYFLGGEIALDADRARTAIEELAETLGLSAVEAANGVVEIANAAMVNALHLVSVQRGYDPRGFVLIGFGGAGPAHVNALAREIGVQEVIVPTAPGIFSATGLLSTDLKRDYTAALLARVDELQPGVAEAAFARMEDEGRHALRREGVEEADVSFVRQMELRYVGQSYELTVPADDVGAAVAGFHDEHDRAYGFSAEQETVELVNLRLTAVGRIAKPPLPLLDASDAQPRERARRPVYFAESGGYVDCPVYDRYGLGAGAELAGPAVVEEFDSTTVVHPGYGARVDEHGNIRLRAV